MDCWGSDSRNRNEIWTIPTLSWTWIHRYAIIPSTVSTKHFTHAGRAVSKLSSPVAGHPRSFWPSPCPRRAPRRGRRQGPPPHAGPGSLRLLVHSALPACTRPPRQAQTLIPDRRAAGDRSRQGRAAHHRPPLRPHPLISAPSPPTRQDRFAFAAVAAASLIAIIHGKLRNGTRVAIAAGLKPS